VPLDGNGHVVQDSEKDTERVTVMVAASALERSKSKSAHMMGSIWLHHDGNGGETADFPGCDWSDFVVVVLGWWLAGIRDLHQGAEQVEFRFMDGPLFFSVTPHDSATYRIRCVRDGLNSNDQLYDWFTSIAHFEFSLYEAALASLAECDRQGWKSRDIDTLQEALRVVRVQVAV
jgi:hypothetical protein